MFCSIQSSFSSLFKFHKTWHKTTICACVRERRWKRRRNTSTSTNDRAIHLRRMTERMDRYILDSLAFTCVCVSAFSLFFRHAFSFSSFDTLDLLLFLSLFIALDYRACFSREFKNTFHVYIFIRQKASIVCLSINNDGIENENVFIFNVAV